MLAGEQFVLTLSATGADTLTGAPSPSHTTSGTSSDSHPREQPAQELVELLRKWGVNVSGAANCGCLLQRFNYRVGKSDSAASESGEEATAGKSAPIAAGALRFHDGLATDLLNTLFTHESFLATLQHVNGSVRVPSADQMVSALVMGVSGASTKQRTLVHYEKLHCLWTDLSRFDPPLRNANIVRMVEDPRSPQGGGDGSHGAPVLLPMPVVKRVEELLPRDVVVADEVRALFLQAHSQKKLSSLDNGDDAEVKRVSNGGMDGTSESDDDEEDDYDYYGYGEGAKLSKKELQAVFTPQARREFLYHIVWRLVAGGGPMNQFEDDFTVYKQAARDLYRALVTSILAKPTTVTKLSGTVDQLDEDTEGAEQETRYTAEVTSLVYRITGLNVSVAPSMGDASTQRRQIKKPALFPISDGMSPSNLNYCYVIVNPIQQTVVVWYHGLV